MKKLSNVILVTCLAVAALLSGCDKEVETSALKVDESQKGTLECYVYADINLTTYEKEAVPAGTKVILSISNYDLIGRGTGNWTDTVVTDANGYFKKDVPATSKGVTVTIIPIDFVYAQVQPLTSKDKTISKIFKADNKDVYVYANDKTIENVEYSSPVDFSNFTEFVTFKGKGFIDLDEGTPGTESAVPTDVKVIFYTTNGSNWSKEVSFTSTTIDGKSYSIYSVDVPKNASISCRYSFAKDRLVNGSNVKYVFDGKVDLYSSDRDVTGKDVYFDKCTKFEY
ncbi:MAG TPA: hypothetical protein VHO90_03040 [Bacteroidales bacterium]|nr:hypothetical protein [Bacteroidales bacterium]